MSTQRLATVWVLAMTVGGCSSPAETDTAPDPGPTGPECTGPETSVTIPGGVPACYLPCRAGTVGVADDSEALGWNFHELADILWDPDHCGACGAVCEVGAVCISGECSPCQGELTITPPDCNSTGAGGTVSTQNDGAALTWSKCGGGVDELRWPVDECITIDGNFNHLGYWPLESRIVEVTGTVRAGGSSVTNGGYNLVRPGRVGGNIQTGGTSSYVAVPSGLDRLEEFGGGPFGPGGALAVSAFPGFEFDLPNLRTVGDDGLEVHLAGWPFLKQVSLPFEGVMLAIAGIGREPIDDVLTILGASYMERLEVKEMLYTVIRAPDVEIIDALDIGVSSIRDLDFPNLTSCTIVSPVQLEASLPQCEYDALVTACAGGGWTDCP